MVGEIVQTYYQHSENYSETHRRRGIFHIENIQHGIIIEYCQQETYIKYKVPL